MEGALPADEESAGRAFPKQFAWFVHIQIFAALIYKKGLKAPSEQAKILKLYI